MAAMHVSEALARFHSAGLTRGTEITKPVLAEFVLQLGECDATLLEAATTEWISISAWLPKPAELLAIVRRLESESPSKPAEPEHWRRDTYRCQLCRDTGYVSIWHPRAMAAAIAYLANEATEDVFRRNQYQAAAKCTCQRGQDRPGSAAAYNPDRHVKIDHWSHSERVKALLDRAKNLKPANYVAEFDEWRGEPV